MAGGKGTRLRPLTCDLPKPMVPLLNKPVMEYTLELLQKYDITDVGVTLAYLPDNIEEYFSNKYGPLNIRYFVEDIPLGTGGSVKNAEEFLDDTFIVISGDAITDMNIKKALEFHKRKGSKATLVLKKEPVPLEYGVILLDREGKVKQFLEKPSWGEVFSDTINTGIYILEPEVLNYYKKGENFDFSKDLFPKLLRDRVPIYGYVTENYWCDIGDLNSYKETQFYMLDKNIDVHIKGKEIKPNIWIGKDTIVGKNVKITPPIFIGNNCEIEDGVELNSYSIIGDNCKIGTNSSIKRSILWNGVDIGENNEIRGSVLCDHVHTHKNVSIYEDAVIGTSTHLLSNASISSSVKIWPNKKVDDGTKVYEDIIWGTKYTKNIFGQRNISGHLNKEMTSEFASKLGGAFASAMGNKDIFVIGCNGSYGTQYLKNALISGIMATGAYVIDIKETLMPITRFAIDFFGAKGGIYVDTDYMDKDRVQIELMNSNGANIDRAKERKVENLLNRGDYPICGYRDVKVPLEINNFNIYYIKRNIEEIERYKSDGKKIKIVLASYAKEAIDIAQSMLDYMGVDIQGIDIIDTTTKLDDYVELMTNKIKKHKYDLGIILSGNGEQVWLIDSQGNIVNGHRYFLLAVLIMLKKGFKEKIIVPYHYPDVIERMTKKYDIETKRVKSDISSIMNETLKSAANKTKNQYNLIFDGILGTVTILDYMVKENVSLAKILEEIPDYHFIKRDVHCQWDKKGEILRKIIEDHENDNIEMFEGVKINDDRGWALILPHSEKPLFKIYAQGDSEEFAKELSIFYDDKLKEMVKNSTLET